MDWKEFELEKEVTVDVDGEDVVIKKEVSVSVGITCNACGKDLTFASEVDSDNDIAIYVDKCDCEE